MPIKEIIALIEEGSGSRAFGDALARTDGTERSKEEDRHSGFGSVGLGGWGDRI
jgi:hypothetical protein